MEIFITAIIFMVLGVSTGSVITQLILKSRSIGTLRVDNSDPDGPYLFLELETSPDTLEHATYVQMKVNKTNYISQK